LWMMLLVDVAAAVAGVMPECEVGTAVVGE
jgi:hypothetical protein